MTKAELVRRTAKRSGVPDSEAKIFFEMFLRLISKQVLHGNGLHVKGIGIFRLRKGKIRKVTPEKGAEFIYTDLVVFSTGLDQNESSKDQLLFSVPQTDEDDFVSPDYHFSLSIGKPVIPIKGLKHSEFFIPPGGQELRRLLFSKAEKLFKESELIKKENEEKDFLVIKPEQGSVIPESEKKEEEPPEINLTKLNWSSEDINKEIERESLLDFDRLSGSPGITEEEPDLKDIVKRNSGDLAGAEEFNIDESKAESQPQAPNPELGKDPIDNKFERVRSVTGSRERKKWDEEQPAKTKAGEDERIKAGYSPVKSKMPLAPEPVIQKGESRHTNAEDSVQVEKDYSRRRTKASFIIVFTLLLFSVAAAVIFITPGLNFLTGNESSVQIKQTAVKPVIIERSYNIPVTYPYDKTGIDEAGFFFEPFSLSSQNKIPVDQAQNNSTEVKENSKNTSAPPAGSDKKISTGIVPEKIKDNIYRYNDYFVVQVSSWKSLTKAESEVERYNSSGYNAFLEEAMLKTQGKYYRVRVGQFKSVEEAEDFLKKNI